MHFLLFISRRFLNPKNARRRLGRDPAATLPGCDLFAGAHTAHSRIPSPFPSARPHFFVSIANFVPKRAWHPLKANPAHSKASHYDGLNFVGCHDLWYLVCETISRIPVWSQEFFDPTSTSRIRMEERARLRWAGPQLHSFSIDPRFRHFAALARRTAASGGRRPIRFFVFLQRP